MFNPSPMLTQEEVDKVTWNDVDYLVVNEDELIALYVALTGLSDKVDYRAALQELHSHALMSNTNIVATRGAQGLSATSAALAQHAWQVTAPAGQLLQPLVNTVSLLNIHCLFLI